MHFNLISFSKTKTGGKMQKLIFKTGLLIITILFSLIFLTSCAEKKDEGKIEITTMSSAAKNEFVQGRDLL